MTCTEDQPNGMAMPKPQHVDPWAEEEPVVRHFVGDSPKEQRTAKALEAATRRALSDPRAP
jgi:hypothetical protein